MDSSSLVFRPSVTLPILLGTRMRHVTEHGLQFFEMLARSRMDDDGSVLPGSLNLPDTVPESLEPSPDLRGTEVHVQVLALDVRHGKRIPSLELDQEHSSRIRKIWQVGRSYLRQRQQEANAILQRPFSAA